MRRGRSGAGPRWWIAPIVAVLLGVPHGVAQLDTSLRDQLEQQADDYEELLLDRRDEIARLEEALGATRAELEARIAERDRVSARIAELANEERALNRRIAELEEEIAATEARIAEEEANLGALRGRIRALLVNLHRQRAGRAVNALAGAESLHDLRVKNTYLNMLSRQDVELVAEVDAQLTALNELRTRLAGQVADLAATRDDLTATRTELEANRAQLQSIIAELNETEEGQQAQRAALLRAQQDLEAELASVRDERDELSPSRCDSNRGVWQSDGEWRKDGNFVIFRSPKQFSCWFVTNSHAKLRFRAVS